MRDASEITVTNEKEDAKKKSIQFCIVDEETREVMNVSLPFNLTGVVDEMNPIWMDNCTSFNVLYGEFDLTTTNKPVDYTFGSNFTGGHMTVTIDDTVERIDILYKPAFAPLEIRKVDALNLDKVLSGAIFTILNEREAFADQITTSETGYAVTKLLKYGTYTIHEVESPLGYARNTEPITVTIPAELQIITNNPTKDITICIIDEETGEPIFDPARFNFVNNSYFYVSNCIVEPIPYGTWTLTGITPPEFYTGSALITGIVIDDAYTGRTITIPYRYVGPTLTIHKYDEADGTPLS